jgi:zinc/manganese transport system substrate-binding protein
MVTACTMPRLRLLCLLWFAIAAWAGEVRVVATLPVIADLVDQVGGSDVRVETLVPAGSDVHDFQAAPADAQRVAQADLVIANGLGLEPWLPGLIAASGWKGTAVTASAGVAGQAADGQAIDPHAFQDVRNAQRYVVTIRDALLAVDPARAGRYRARCELVQARLAVLDGWIRRQVAAIPAERRLVVTPHDGLAAFAAAYGLELQSLEGAAEGQEADAKRIDELAALLRRRGVRAVFAEAGHPTGVLANLAHAAGAQVVGPLASDGPGAGQGYDAMIAANTLLLTDALR